MLHLRKHNATLVLLVCINMGTSSTAKTAIHGVPSSIPPACRQKYSTSNGSMERRKGGSMPRRKLLSVLRLLQALEYNMRKASTLLTRAPSSSSKGCSPYSSATTLLHSITQHNWPVMRLVSSGSIPTTGASLTVMHIVCGTIQ